MVLQATKAGWRPGNEASQRVIPLRSLKENICEAPLLSVSVRSYDQNKTIHNLYERLYRAPARHVFKMAHVQNGVSGS